MYVVALNYGMSHAMLAKELGAKKTSRKKRAPEVQAPHVASESVRSAQGVESKADKPHLSSATSRSESASSGLVSSNVCRDART